MHRTLTRILLAASVVAAAAWPSLAGAQTGGPTIVPPKLTHFEPAQLPEGVGDAYPDGARIEVVLALTIDKEGKVKEVTLRKEAGEPFDGAATAAARRFVFEAATVDGVPVEVIIPYTYTFELVRTEREIVVEPEPEPEPEPAVASQATLRGRFLTKGTRMPVVGVTVELVPADEETATPREALTDEEGYFEMPGLPDGAFVARVMDGAYRPWEKKVTIADQQDVKLRTVRLRKDPQAEYRTVIRDKTPKRSATVVKLVEQEVKSVPGTFGEPTRVIATLPGVARSPFGLGYYVVRGAGFQNTGTHLGGFPIPLLYHLFGGPSVINNEFIGGVDFYPGGYPPEFGRYTAGLIDVNLKTAPRDSWHLILELDILKAGGFASVPFDDGKGVVAVAGRRSYYELLLPSFTDDFNLSYWDYQAQVAYDFSPETKLSVFIHGAGDDTEFRSGKSEEGFRNEQQTGVSATMFHRGLIHFSHEFDKQTSLVSDTCVGYYDTDMGFSTEGADPFRIRFGTLEVQERLTLRHKMGEDGVIYGGVDFRAIRFDARIAVPIPSDIGSVPKPAFDFAKRFTGRMIEEEYGLAGFFAYDWLAVPGLRIIPGLRVDWFHYNGHDEATADPRLTVRWTPIDWLTIKGNTGMYHQPPPVFQVDEKFGSPGLPPQSSVQTSLGAEFRFLGDWEVDITGFYNLMMDLPIATADVEAGGSGLDRQPYVAEGLGRSFGLEVMVRKKFGDFVYGWLTYTLSRSERRDRYGEWSPFSYDQTHILNLAWTFELPLDFTVGFRFRLTTGNPSDRLAGAVYDADADSYDPLYDGTERAPIFHQLDLRIDKKFVFNNWIFAIYIDIQNLYYAKNTEFWSYKYDWSEREKVSGFPILPTIGFKAVF